MITLETTPDTLAWALIEQIISSRQPLPCSVLETPTTYLVVPPPPDEPPHATRANAATSKAATKRPAASGRSRCVTDDHLLFSMRPTRAPADFLLLPNAPSLHLLSSTEAARRPPRMLPVSGLEELVRTPASHLGGACDHRRQLARGDEKLRGAHLDRIGDRHRRERRA